MEGCGLKSVGFEQIYCRYRVLGDVSENLRRAGSLVEIFDGWETALDSIIFSRGRPLIKPHTDFISSPRENT